MAISKGQIWSYDILIAAGIFVISFIFFYSLISVSSPKTITSSLTGDGNIIANAVTKQKHDSNITFVIDDTIDPLRLKRFSEQNYTSIKSNLGLKNEFCIHFEDENGELIEIGEIKSVGSSNLNLTVNDEIIPCGQNE